MSKAKAAPKAAHALLSASGASRWLICTPSAVLELQFPKTSSTYADEGTEAHEVCELAARYWLGELTEQAYESTLATLAKGQYYNAEMQECAVDYGRFISETVKERRTDCPDAFVELEAKSLDFSEWAPEGFGTGDCIIIADGLLEVIDFKYGKGVRVEAEGNAQMRLYALGAIKRYRELYDIEQVRMSIIQPRISSTPSTSEITIAELMDWAENYVKPRAALAYTGKGEFNPCEEACKFCRAKEQCKARADKNLALFDEAPDASLITVEEVSAILAKAGDIKTWLSDLEKLCMKTLFAGEPVPGFKLVEGRSNRRFVDEIKVAKALKAAGYADAVLYKPKELITLTQMEKDFGKKNVGTVLKGLIIKPAGAPTLAPEKDTRPAFIPAELILEAFDEE